MVYGKRHAVLPNVSLLMVVFTIIPIWIGWTNDYPFSPSIPGGGDQMSLDYMFNFYMVPWCRYQPYLVGLGLGYLLYKMKNQPKLNLNPIAVTWIWAIAFAVGSVVIYGLVPYQKDPTLVASIGARSMYGGLHRLAWSLAVSWVILACVKGVGGPVNSILSWPAWIPLARMSYCIYLVHMTVMSVVNTQASYRVNISQILIIYYIIFVLCLSIAISYALIIAFEAPIVHLEKLLYYFLGISGPPKIREHISK